MKKNVMIIEKINTKPQWNVKSLRVVWIYGVQ